MLERKLITKRTKKQVQQRSWYSTIYTFMCLCILQLKGKSSPFPFYWQIFTYAMHICLHRGKTKITDKKNKKNESTHRHASGLAWQKERVSGSYSWGPCTRRHCRTGTSRWSGLWSRPTKWPRDSQKARGSESWWCAPRWKASEGGT